MNKKTRDIVDRYLQRADTINRAIEGEVSKMQGRMNSFNKKIIKRIEKEYPDINSYGLNKLKSILEKEIKEFYANELKESAERTSGQLVLKETLWQSKGVQVLIGEQTIKLASAELATQVVAKKTFEGHTFDFWFRLAGSKNLKKINGLLTTGFMEGRTTQQIVADVLPISNKSSAEVRTLVRSYLQSAANTSKELTYRANEELFEGFIWLSVLDGRTTPNICGVRDQLEYDLDYNPVGHGYEWEAGPGRIHFNCRSTSIPKIKSKYGFNYDRFEIERPAVGAGGKYVRGDKTNSLGRVRRFTKDTREKEIFKIVHVPKRTDYETWLRTQPESFIADSLGNITDARLFKSGGMSLAEYTAKTLPINITNL